MQPEAGAALETEVVGVEGVVVVVLPEVGAALETEVAAEAAEEEPGVALVGVGEALVDVVEIRTSSEGVSGVGDRYRCQMVGAKESGAGRSKWDYIPWERFQECGIICSKG